MSAREIIRGMRQVSEAAERFDLLHWAGQRPDVLALLRALRDEDFGEVHYMLRRFTRTEHRVRIKEKK